MVAAAIAVSAAVSAGASMMASSEQAGAAENAAGLSAEATRMSVAEQRRQFDLTRQDLAPYREIGATALAELGALYGIGPGGLLPINQADAPAAGAPASAAPAPAATSAAFADEVRLSVGPGRRLLVNGQDTGFTAGSALGNAEGNVWIDGVMDDLGAGWGDEGELVAPSGFTFRPVSSLPSQLRDRLGIPDPAAAGAAPAAPAQAPGAPANGLLPTSTSMEAARDRFQETPGYQFAYDEGIRALDRSASAGGRLMGGGHERELIRYGQGIANQEFGNYANRLASLAGVGQSAVGTGAQAGSATAANVGNILMQGASNQGNALMAAATARASGYTGVANAANSGINNYLFANALR